MSVSPTARPEGARAHARAMAGTRVEAMPTVPATSASDPPEGVRSEDLIWEETLGPGGYAARELNRGARLRLTDVHGDGCVSMLVFNAQNPVERLNVADTLKVQWNAYLGAGRLLLSDMGRVLLSILDDTSAGHDALCAPSNARLNAQKYGEGSNHGPHPNARDRFLIALGKYGLGAKDVHACVTWFKPVRVLEDGTTRLEAGPFSGGASVTLRAEMNLIVVLANCPHALDRRPRYSVTGVRATAWRGPVTPEDDPVRIATPEGLRAFQNVEEYYRR